MSPTPVANIDLRATQTLQDLVYQNHGTDPNDVKEMYHGLDIADEETRYEADTKASLNGDATANADDEQSVEAENEHQRDHEQTSKSMGESIEDDSGYDGLKLNLLRLGEAVQTAIHVSRNHPETFGVLPDFINDPKTARFVNIAFVSTEYWTVPWEACYSWKVVNVLLRVWFKGDTQCMADIRRGDVHILRPDDCRILPSTWEQVVIQNDYIRLHPFSSPDGKGGRANYEGRVRYNVNYWQKSADEELSLMYQRTYHEPVVFEVADNDDTLPALEETKDVRTPHYRDSGNIAHNTLDKKAELGSLDRIFIIKLKINSSYLLNVLKSIIDYSADYREAYGVRTGEFEYPFDDLYHSMAELLDYKTDTAGLRAQHSDVFNQKCDEHIDLLQNYLTARAKIPVEQFRLRCEKRTPVVTYATYWMLLKPGTDVYVREDDGSLNAYIAEYVSGGAINNEEEERCQDYKVYVWNLAFGGTHISPRRREINISVFDNEREISSLRVFPARFHDETDAGALKRRLIDRGRRYLEYSKRPSYLEYTGKGVKEASKMYKNTRVVVEHITMPWEGENFKIDHHRPGDDTDDIRKNMRVPQCECKDCRENMAAPETYAKERFAAYYSIKPGDVTDLTEHQYMLMSSHMYAFVLNERIYDLLDVSGLAEPSMAESAIDNLVMGRVNKDLIKAVAKIFTDADQSNRFSADYIQGKGEGQIILLHGSPGTGKTLTAESVAEYIRRPLISITAADLGHEPAELESRLLRYFKRARDWDAIVLLDEADVYLEQRTTHDLKRNGIVSVFLRALDYFQGILFLTTNRVGHFDEAFISRIHLSLGYEKLDNLAREKIWDNLFKKLANDHKRGGSKIDYEYDAKGYVKSREVQELEWNGREIRNAFQTAVALAIFDAKRDKKEPPEMTEKHLRSVVSMSRAFRKYMMAAHSGMDDSTWAFKHGNREDKFPSTPAKTDA